MGEGEGECKRKEGEQGKTFFLMFFTSPTPSPFTPAMQVTRKQNLAARVYNVKQKLKLTQIQK